MWVPQVAAVYYSCSHFGRVATQADSHPSGVKLTVPSAVRRLGRRAFRRRGIARFPEIRSYENRALCRMTCG
eukprot:3237432-Prymnesium_polylepis.1